MVHGLMRTGATLLAGVAVCGVLCAADPTPQGPSAGVDKACVQARAGLPFCFRKLAAGDKLRISFYGGGAAVGEGASQPELCYRALLPPYLRRLYPKAQAGGYDYTATGNGSWLGAFSVGKDSYYGVNDLFILDFALDDADTPEDRICESMEGIVRQLRSRSPEVEFLFLYAFSQRQMESFRKGEMPACIRAQERVAAHYGIPSVNVAKVVADRILAGDLSLDEFPKDGARPTDKGHALYLEAMKPLFDLCKAGTDTNTAAAARVLPKPLTAHPLENAQSIFYDWCILEGRWKTGQASPSERFTHVLVSDNPGDTLTVTFTGESAGYVGVSGPDSGDLEFSVDGGDWKPHANFLPDAGSSFRVHAALLARDLAPGARHELKLRVAAGQPKGSRGRVIRIGFVLVNGSVTGPYQGLTGLPLIDTVYASMAPLQYTPDPGRWTFLPRTLKRLQEGPSLRIVMLGDSIINDTADSKFDLLLGRMYPKCRIEKIASTRGSTGCNWYKAENRVQDYVIKHNPEVLIIGGISNGDAESVREVIKQVRAKIAPEILVMTPVFGSNDKDVMDVKATPRDIDPNGKDYRAALKRVAEEEKVEFLDMTGPWAQYIRDSGKTYGWFRRDRVHANGRGKQILGRVLESFFAPKER